MKLPNRELAVIAENKVRDYLLDIDHEWGGSKAKLLISMGYEATDWKVLVDDICRFHLQADVAETTANEYGSQFVIVAPLTGPLGRTVVFRSVWQIDLGANYPRLITMYPE